MSAINTKDSSYEITLFTGKSYLITTNIDIFDEIINGPSRMLVYIDYCNNDELTNI